MSWHAIRSEHGGELSVESPPGRGTRFTLELPLAPGMSATGERLK